MEIIKDAFVEGRETQTPWEKSKAKKNQIKAEVALENFSAMSKRQKLQLIPLHMICPTTGDTLHTFPSRIAAARYIVEHILKRPDKNPLSITGNLEMCMRAGWRSYGYFWKLADESFAARKEVTAPKKPVDDHTFANAIFTAKRIWYRVNGTEWILASASDASRETGISTWALAKLLNPNTKNAVKELNGRMVMHYNETPQTLTFPTKAAAARYFNCGEKLLNNILAEGGVVNNFKIKIG